MKLDGMEISDNESEPLVSDEHDVTHLTSKIRFPSCRLVLTIMGFLGFVNAYCLRVNLSVALVAMLNNTQQHYSDVTHNRSAHLSDETCQSNESVGETTLRNGEFNWDSHTQGTVLAAFFYGYIMTQV